MLRAPALTDQQISDFQRDGFVLVRGALDGAAMAQIVDWTDELARRPEETGQHWVYREASQIDPAESLICRIENISPFHTGFAELSRALEAPAAQLLGEQAILFKEKTNFKMPGGGSFEPHQDSQAGWWTYADYFVMVTVCIDEATVENGCLKLAPGPHKHGLYREWEPLTSADMKDMEFVATPTKPGDLIFFDSYTPHGSDPNRSATTRRLYFVTYNRKSVGNQMARYYADKHETYPPDIDRRTDREYTYRV